MESTKSISNAVKRSISDIIAARQELIVSLGVSNIEASVNIHKKIEKIHMKVNRIENSIHEARRATNELLLRFDRRIEMIILSLDDTTKVNKPVLINHEDELNPSLSTNGSKDVIQPVLILQWTEGEYRVYQTRIPQLKARRHEGYKIYSTVISTYTGDEEGWYGLDAYTNSLYHFKEKIDATLFIKCHMMNSTTGTTVDLSATIYNNIGKAISEPIRDHHIFKPTETDTYGLNRFKWYFRSDSVWNEIPSHNIYYKVTRKSG